MTIILILMDSHDSQESNNEGLQKTIGPFVFTCNIPRKLKQLLKHMYRNYKPNAESLRIQNGRFQDLVPQQALSLASFYRIQQLVELSLTNNSLSETSFLRKCNFQNLLVLNLSRNKLNSLAELCQNLHFPLLEELLLCNNQFTSNRGIKRWNMSYLLKLTLQLNFIVDIKGLSQAYLPSLCHLQLYSNNIADFRHIFRTNFPRLQTLQIYSNSYNNDICTNFAVLQRKFRYLSVGTLKV